jgi:polysaccharide export outer membrane protein
MSRARAATLESRKAIATKATAWLFALAMCLALAALVPARAQEVTTLALKMSSGLSTPPSDPARVAPLPRSADPVVASASLGDYRIGPEDLLEVQVFGVEQLARTVRVNSFGMISLPLIGAIPLGGMTAQEAEKLIARKLAENYLQDPQVSVFIKEYTNQRVTIEGAVTKPGIYPLRGQTTLLRTLAIAGGQGSLSDMSNVMVFRADASGRRDSQVYDVERIRRGEIDDPTILNDDVIVVNRSAARVVLKDSIVRDALDAINPFSYIPR